MLLVVVLLVSVTARPFALLVLNNQSRNIGGSCGLFGAHCWRQRRHHWCAPLVPAKGASGPVPKATIGTKGAKGNAPKATCLKSISGPI